MIYRYILDLIDDGLIRKGRALDIGSGTGMASTLLSSLGFDVDAVDKENSFVPVSNGGGVVTFIKSDLRDFAIAENNYDFINARNVLHFLSKDEIRTALHKMYNGLKRRGVMYFNVSGDKDGWKNKSKNVTFLTGSDLEIYVECVLPLPIYNKVTRLGIGTTTSGIQKFVHTISYTVIKR